MNIQEKSRAISSLRPGGEWAIVGGVFTWYKDDKNGNGKPTDSELEAENTRLKEKDAAEAYKGVRQKQYPSFGDQLDDLYKQGVFSADMTAKIKKVKDDNPKP